MLLLQAAAALCCLCSALLTTAEELIQEDLTLTRRVGEQVSFSCGQTNRCDDDWVYWYQKKDTETFSVILYIKTQETVCSTSSSWISNSLKLQTHSTCSSSTFWTFLKSLKGSYTSSSQVFVRRFLTVGVYIFGSGTKLFVSGQSVVKPKVSVYPAAPRAQLERNSSLLCVASNMYPPVVQISWKRQKEDGGLEVLKPRESMCTASVLKLQWKEKSLENYVCSVQHEGGVNEGVVDASFLPPALTTIGPPEIEPTEPTEAPATSPPRPTETEPTGLPALQQMDSSLFQSECRLKLLSGLYSLLIVKSLVFCCGLSLLRILTNKPASISCSCAD